jgi:hypothetical protein
VSELRIKLKVSRPPPVQQKVVSAATRAPPPTLSSNVIRRFGREFCKISTAKLSDEDLLKVTIRKKAVIAKKSKSVKTVKTEKVNNEDKPNKKSRND